MLSFLDLPGLRKLLTKEPAFGTKMAQVAESLGLDASLIMNIMSLESGLNPQAVNPQGGATGLIQFMPETAKRLGTTVEALRQMRRSATRLRGEVFHAVREEHSQRGRLLHGGLHAGVHRCEP